MGRSIGFQRIVGMGIVLLAIGLCGCVVVPTRSKTTSRHAYSAEALKFLDLPDARRPEVLATLGEPVATLPDLGVLIYTWERTARFWVMAPTQVNGDLSVDVGAGKVSGASQMWVLFVACDAEGKIVGHQVAKLSSGDPEHEARAWFAALRPNP